MCRIPDFILSQRPCRLRTDDRKAVMEDLQDRRATPIVAVWRGPASECQSRSRLAFSMTHPGKKPDNLSSAGLARPRPRRLSQHPLMTSLLCECPLPAGADVRVGQVHLKLAAQARPPSRFSKADNTDPASKSKPPESRDVSRERPWRIFLTIPRELDQRSPCWRFVSSSP